MVAIEPDVLLNVISQNPVASLKPDTKAHGDECGCIRRDDGECGCLEDVIARQDVSRVISRE